ncbi:MAG: hypothetical protein P8J87_06120 [Verrucomicrobiales bacterium]|nr:hypothetical protein [Verrucomicrobiales bacterium]
MKILRVILGHPPRRGVPVNPGEEGVCRPAGGGVGVEVVGGATVTADLFV